MTNFAFPEAGFVLDYDVVCFSHLRWDFVFQRPQHRLSRFAKKHSVLFIEEPIYIDGAAGFVVTEKKGGVKVAVPHLPEGTGSGEAESILAALVFELVRDERFENYVTWFYTPMMLPLSTRLEPRGDTLRYRSKGNGPCDHF